MKRNVLFVLGSILMLTLLAAGVGYAWSPKSSDVDAPVTTSSAHTLKYHVIGTSMEPTIKYGDWLSVNTKVTSVVPGQIVIFRYPKDPSVIYCRRVIAVDDDRVDMKYYSNVKITTVYSPDRTQGTIFPAGAVPNGNAYGEFTTLVGEDSFYVVGDNTAPGASYDSDEWGTVPMKDLIGVVTARISPSPRSF